MSVTQFYNTLTKYWQQIDAFEKHKWKCANDGLLYKEIVEQKIIFKFLLGLNQNLDAVRGQVLAAKPLPNIREVFFELQESTAEVYGTGAIAQKGTFSNALSAKINKKKSWIVDSDASDHMTGDAKVFKSFIPYHGFDFGEDDWQC
ncbi:hypothetical protein ACOSP7_027257 [Xanthoceras sorbifolium]